MPDEMNLAAYKGRTIDLLVFHGTEAGGYKDAGLSSESGGEVCSGILKLAQAWMVEFLTPKGSDPYDSEAGEEFVNLARQGSLKDEADVFLAFGVARQSIAVKFSAIELEADPEDEKLDDAVVENLSLSPGYISMRIKISSAAGTEREFIVPVPTLPV